MAKTVAEKLLIKPNTALWSSHPGQEEILQPLPEGVRPVERLKEADVAVPFAETPPRSGNRWPNVVANFRSPASPGLRIRRGTGQTSTATACGRCCLSTGCGRSARWQWTPPGRH